MHCSGVWQVPPRHCSSALQQLTVSEQDWPVAAQMLPVEQVPLVAPAGMSQIRPAQQSPLVVQLLPEVTQGGRQVPPSQLPAQQSAWTVQAPPIWLLQPVAGRHLKVWLAASSWQASGSQQDGSSAPAHAPLRGVQAESAAQWRTPLASGTQGASPQHCSRNWQTEPGPLPWGMQQAGSAPSQPPGQVVLMGPPKQRRMPARSGLQTGLPLPDPSWQQFCEAFTSVLAPQMLPGGLQEPPLSHVCSMGLHATACAGGTWSLMLQQASVRSQ